MTLSRRSPGTGGKKTGGAPVVRVMQHGSLLVRVRLERSVITRPAVRAVRPQARLHARQALAVAVRDEVVRVAVRDVLVVLLHDGLVDVVHGHLEQGDLLRRIHDAVALGQRLVVGQDERVELHGSVAFPSGRVAGALSMRKGERLHVRPWLHPVHHCGTVPLPDAPP